jgi:hypothetical protein
VRRQTVYEPVLEDWIWHFTLPPIGYAILLIAAIIVQSNPTVSLFVVGATVLLFLFIGIHNAWDSATFIALQQRQQEEWPQVQADPDVSPMPPAPNSSEQ